MRRLARLQSETVREVAEVSVTQATQAAARYWRSWQRWAAADALPEGVVTAELARGLDLLRSAITAWRSHLGAAPMSELWRAVAQRVDRWLGEHIVVAAQRVEFSAAGVAQLQTDVEAVFALFAPFSARPENYVRSAKEAIALLALPEPKLRGLLN